MLIDDEELTEFMKLYREEFGEEITSDEARGMAQDLLWIYDLLMQPYPGEVVSPPPQSPP